MPTPPTRPRGPLLSRGLRAGRRSLAVGRRLADVFPFTPLGVVTVGAAGLALVRWGIKRVDLLYLVIGSVGLGLGLLSLLLTTVVAVVLRLSLRTADPLSTAALRLECGVRSATGFSLPSLWYLPMIRVRWSWLAPAGTVRSTRSGRRVHEEVTPVRRGLAEYVERRLEVSDAFALTRLAFRHREARAVRALPSVGALKQIQVLRSIASGEDAYHPEGNPEGERMDMRGYEAGDPVRFVLWKVFAKTRQLVIRTPERALSPSRRTLAYVVTGRGDEAAAGAARMALETGALGSTWTLGADGEAQDASNAGDALELLARSAAAGADVGGAGLQAFLRRASPASTARAIVFVPAFAGPWVDRVVAVVRARTGSSHAAPVQFLVCADGIERGRGRSLLGRAMVRGHAATADARPHAKDLAALVDRLASTRAAVLLVDRQHGRVYPKGHRRGLLDPAVTLAAAPAVAKPRPARGEDAAAPAAPEGTG